MNIARPKGDKGGDRGGRGGGRGGGGGGGRREEIEGAKVFVYNVSEETGNDDLKKAFGKHGTIASPRLHYARFYSSFFLTKQIPQPSSHHTSQFTLAPHSFSWSPNSQRLEVAGEHGGRAGVL